MPVEDATRKAEKDIRSILLSAPKGLTPEELEHDYYNLTGGSIPYEALGFSTLRQFVESSPHLVRVQRAPNGGLRLFKVSHEATRHLEVLVAEQKCLKTSRLGSVAQPAKARPLVRPFAAKPRAASTAQIEFREKVCRLLREANRPIAYSNFSNLYERRYKESFPARRLFQVNSLTVFKMHLSDIVQMHETDGEAFLSLRSTNNQENYQTNGVFYNDNTQFRSYTNFRSENSSVKKLPLQQNQFSDQVSARMAQPPVRKSKILEELEQAGTTQLPARRSRILEELEQVRTTSLPDRRSIVLEESGQAGTTELPPRKSKILEELEQNSFKTLSIAAASPLRNFWSDSSGLPPKTLQALGSSRSAPENLSEQASEPKVDQNGSSSGSGLIAQKSELQLTSAVSGTSSSEMETGLSIADVQATGHDSESQNVTAVLAEQQCFFQTLNLQNGSQSSSAVSLNNSFQRRNRPVVPCSVRNGKVNTCVLSRLIQSNSRANARLENTICSAAESLTQVLVADRQNTLKHVEENCRKTLKKNPAGVLASRFPNEYHVATREKLDLARLGFESMADFVRHFSDVFVVSHCFDGMKLLDKAAYPDRKLPPVPTRFSPTLSKERPEARKPTPQLTEQWERRGSASPSFGAWSVPGDAGTSRVECKKPVSWTAGAGSSEPLSVLDRISHYVDNHRKGVPLEEIQRIFKDQLQGEERASNLFRFLLVDGIAQRSTDGVYRRFVFRYEPGGHIMVRLVRTNDGAFACLREAAPLDYVMEMSSQDWPVDVDTLDQLPSDQRLFTVTVAQFNSPTDFYLQLDSSVPSLNTLMSEMNQFYRSPKGAVFRLPVTFVRIGLLCAAPYALTISGYYRVRVLQLPMGGQVLVNFVDFGSVARVNVTELRYLKREYLRLRAQALPSTLHGVRNAVDASRELLAEAFFALCVTPDLHAYLFGVRDGVSEVSLVAFLDGAARDVTHELIDGGLVVDCGYATTLENDASGGAPMTNAGIDFSLVASESAKESRLSDPDLIDFNLSPVSAPNVNEKFELDDANAHSVGIHNGAAEIGVESSLENGIANANSQAMGIRNEGTEPDIVSTSLQSAIANNDTKQVPRMIRDDTDGVTLEAEYEDWSSDDSSAHPLESDDEPRSYFKVWSEDQPDSSPKGSSYENVVNKPEESILVNLGNDESSNGETKSAEVWSEDQPTSSVKGSNYQNSVDGLEEAILVNIGNNESWNAEIVSDDCRLENKEVMAELESLFGNLMGEDSNREHLVEIGEMGEIESEEREDGEMPVQRISETDRRSTPASDTVDSRTPTTDSPVSTLPDREHWESELESVSGELKAKERRLGGKRSGEELGNLLADIRSLGKRKRALRNLLKTQSAT